MNQLNTTATNDLSERGTKLCITVKDEIFLTLKKAPFVHCEVSCNVFHLTFIRMWSDPSNMYFSATYLNKEQYIKRDHSGSCKQVSRKEITGSDHIFMHSNEVTPRELWFSAGAGIIPFRLSILPTV